MYTRAVSGGVPRTSSLLGSTGAPVGTPGRRPLYPRRRTTNMCSYGVPSLRRAPRPLGLQLPRRRVGARGDGRAGGRAWATRRWRSPTTTGSADRWPSPTPPGRRGCAPSPGPSSPCATASHLTLLAADARGLRQPLPAHHPRPRAHPPAARPPRRCRPPSTAPRLAAHAEGLVCLTGCARARPGAAPGGGGRAPGGRGGGARPGARPRAGQRPRGDPAPALARRPAPGARPRAAGRGAPACPAWRPATPTRTRPRRALLQDAFVAIRHRLTLDGSEDARRGNRRRRAAPARRDGGPVRRPPRRRWPRRLRTGRAAASSTSPATWATASPTSSARTPARRPRPRWRASARTSSARATPTPRKRAAARARLDEELALIAHHDLAGFFLLHRDILELAREVALQVRPAGSARRWLPPGRGRGSSVGSIVCYLTGLSHIDPVENGLFLGRFLNRDMASVPDIDLDFPRDVRERAHRGDHRPLRARARGAGGGLPHLPHPHGHPRSWAAALALPEADLERLARLSDGWSSAQRRGGGAGPPARRRRPSWPRRAGGRWRSWPARRRACPDTCHSTPAAWSSAPARWWSWCPWCPPRSRAGRSVSGTRTPAPTPAS